MNDPGKPFHNKIKDNNKKGKKNKERSKYPVNPVKER